MTAAPPDHDRTLIDWLTITHDKRSPLARCLRGPVERRARGISTYRTAEQDGHGTILAANGPERRPFMLLMSGKPLDAWRAEVPVHDLVRHLHASRVNCTRLDLARDTSGPWTPYRLQELIESDRYVSRSKCIRYYAGKGNTGLTVQVGSRKSEVMLRCYDKKAEIEASGGLCPFDRLSRWELEFKRGKAAHALRRIAGVALQLDATTGVEDWPLRPLHSSWLGQRLRLTTDPVDRDSKNQSRATTLAAWEAFLAGSADDVMAPELDERSPAAQAFEIGRWAVTTLAPTLAMIHALGGDELVAELIGRGRERPSAKRELIRTHASATLPALISAIVEVPRG